MTELIPLMEVTSEVKQTNPCLFDTNDLTMNVMMDKKTKTMKIEMDSFSMNDSMMMMRWTMKMTKIFCSTNENLCSISIDENRKMLKEFH